MLMYQCEPKPKDLVLLRDQPWLTWAAVAEPVLDERLQFV